VAGQQGDVGDGHVDILVEGVVGQVALVQDAAAGQGEAIPGEVSTGGLEVPAGVDHEGAGDAAAALDEGGAGGGQHPGDVDPAADIVVRVLVHHRGGADGHRRPGVDRDGHPVVDLHRGVGGHGQRGARLHF